MANHTHCTRMALVIFVITGVLLVIVPPSDSANFCFDELPELLPKKHFVVDGEIHGIVLEGCAAASHASQSFLNYLFKFLVGEIMGYNNITMSRDCVAPNSYETILTRVSGCSNVSCTEMLAIPKVTINLETWLDTPLSLEPWLDTGQLFDAGSLGISSRYGWYVSSTLVSYLWQQEGIVADHWRGLQAPAMIKELLIPVVQLEEWAMVMPGTGMNSTYYCEREGCVNGIYYPDWCINGYTGPKVMPSDPKAKAGYIACAVMLTDYPENSFRSLVGQINSLILPVIVVWVGPNLKSIVSQRESNNQYTLFHNWQPNDISASGDYNRIAFPTCIGDGSDDQTYQGCDYPFHSVEKVLWRGVMNNAPAIQKFVMKMNISEHNIEQIMKDYHTTSYTMADFACSWAKGNMKLWWPWIPGRRSRRSDIMPFFHSMRPDGILNRRKVYLGGMFPNSGIRWVAPGIEIGAQMALELINQESTLLPNLELELLVKDTQCNKDMAIYEYFQFMGNKSFPIVGIVGPPCAEECEIIGGVSKYFNTISISYSAESPILSSREGFPFFFRTIPDTTEDTLAHVALFDHFNWNRFSLMAEDTSSYTALALYLQNYLVKQGLTLTSSYRFAENSLQDAAMYIRDIKSKKSHIIIGYVNDYSARKLMCEAFKQGTTSYQGYQWFLPDWYPSQWWDTDYYNSPNYIIREDVPCTTAQMAKAIDGYMSLSRVYIADDKNMVVGGLTVREWKNWYRDQTQQKGTEPVDYAAYAYDTVWTYAIALNELIKYDETAIDTITSDVTTHLYMDILANTSFQGVTGHVAFHGADRHGPISIIQHLSKTDSTSIYCIENLIGQFIPNFNNLTQGTLHLNETHIKWVKGQAPNDGSYDLERCPVENLRAFLGVDCRAALAMVNTLLILTLFVITVAIGIWLKKRYDHKVKLAEERMKELGLLGLGGDTLLTLDEFEVPRENVVLNRKLGEGAFGTVYGGEALVDTSKWMAVAVKTLKVDSTIEEKLDFLSEAEMMKRFEHDNIVKLQGVCTRGEPIYAIMEFMLHGDLKTFLLGRRHLVGRDGKEGFEISPHRLSAMVLDIASGLDYLAVNRYVHRDLACRNCLVDAAHTVKIGDFGMTRAMYDSNYYRLGKEGKLPVRWMAPESITEGLFTTKSDVWSLGIVIYEVVTFGSIPYQGLSNADVLDYLRNSNCLAPPRECKPQLAAMMMRCWSLDPADRPNAQDVVEILKDSEELITPCLCEPLASIAHEDLCRTRIPTPQSPMLQLRSGSGGGTLHSNASLDIMTGLGNRLRASFSKARKSSKSFVNSLNEMDELGIHAAECSSIEEKSSQNDDSRPDSFTAANQRSTISVISSTLNYSSSCTSLDQLADNSTSNFRSVDSGSSSGVDCQAEGYSPDSTDQELRKSSTEEALYGTDGQWNPRNSVILVNMEDDLPLIPDKSDRAKHSRSRSEGFKLSGNKQNIKIKTSLPPEDVCHGNQAFDDDNTTFV